MNATAMPLFDDFRAPIAPRRLPWSAFAATCASIAPRPLPWSASAATCASMAPRRRPWSAWAAAFLSAPWRSRTTELRIDVSDRPDELHAELDALYGRLHTPGDRLHGIPAIRTDWPELVLRWREADGEYYVYVEDLSRRRLAGYTVFNRLIELDRRADRHLRAPHSKYDAAYQRRGLASAVYRWGLDAGLCLITGARQSPGANALWHALSRRYELGYVDLRDKTLRYLGRDVSAQVRDDLHTRMILLGRGWSMEAFAATTGMRGVRAFERNQWSAVARNGVTATASRASGA